MNIHVSNNHKSHKQIKKELREAEKKIKVGGVYSHYKNPENLYKVIGFGIQEATDKVCVIYQAEYDKKLIFVRDLDFWLEKVEVEGTLVNRFSEVY